jgi:cytochrome c biogenesis protein
VFLLGLRENPGEPYRYLRMPADENGSALGFTRLRAALQNPTLREQAVRRYATKAVDPKRPELAKQLEGSAARALNLFAGLEKIKGTNVAGLQALSDFMETNVPPDERSRAGEMLVRILNGVLYELQAVAREQAGVKPLAADKAPAFMAQSILALSDAALYPAPMALLLQDFTQVQASVFQVARAPGKSIVYLGCALLIVGIFSMLYVRERRLWVWLEPQALATPGAAQTHAMMALSTNRKTLDGDHEFDHLTRKLLGNEAASI